MTVIVCVLRSGGEYAESHVKRLHDQVMRHAPEGTRFLCLSDEPPSGDVPWEPWCLEHAWPGWFAKMELYRIEGPALYLDLDVSVIRDLSPLLTAAEQHDMVMIRSLWGKNDPNLWNSSVMAWRADAPRCLYDLFAEDPARHIAEHSKLPDHQSTWGDQGIVADYYPGDIEAWDDLLPGAVMSYKRGALMGHDVRSCAVMVSHGSPRPWNPGGADQWLKGRHLLR